jgi:hypothetical protein
MRNGTCGIFAVALVLLAGCQQPGEAPDGRQTRLLAAENADLQRQLAARQAEIEALQQRQTKELRQRDYELIRCKARIAVLEQKLKQGADERATGVAAVVMDENAKLRRQVEELQAQVEKLKKPPEQP